LQWLQKRLQQQHPLSRLRGYQQQLNHLTSKLLSDSRTLLQRKHRTWMQLHSRLLARSPASQIEQQQHRLQLIWQTMQHSMFATLRARQSQLARHASTLHALSPLQTLARGYSITTDKNGHAILSTDKLKQDQIVTTRLQKGNFSSKIVSIEDDV
jgi:exodeoxyribonuclease VII large subunit